MYYYVILGITDFYMQIKHKI
ncbi:protein of unknown function [Citrobacter freundii]|nr:protein of unknown function [Citrobacter freundii]